MNFTTREAADKLGITTGSIARLIQIGMLQATKHGRDYFIDLAEIERYLRERRPAHRPKKGRDGNAET